jgi:hypothetical protein
MKHLPLLFGLVLTVWMAHGAEPASALSASELAAKLSLLQSDGASYVRLKLETQQPPGTKKTALQLQLKQRRSAGLIEVIYQVLWPKERQGEAVLLRKIGNQAMTGSIFTPPNTIHALEAAQMKEGLFGSDLSYADVVENFFAWDHQALTGTEIVNRVSCQVLDSKPGKGQSAGFAVVRTWVDVRHLVPMRVEKYLSSGQLARRIDTTRIANSDGSHRVPANLAVQGVKPDSLTLLEGASIDRTVSYDDRQFTVDGLRDMTVPRSPK